MTRPCPGLAYEVAADEWCRSDKRGELPEPMTTQSWSVTTFGYVTECRFNTDAGTIVVVAWEEDVT